MEPLDLAYEVDFQLDLSNASDQSLLCQMVVQLGVERFSLADLHRVMHPERHPQFIREDTDKIEQAANAMVRNGMFIKSPGPRGGRGWVLSDAAVASARRMARNKATLD